ncbi:three-Cys-motif partner protein TcmP [Nannocystis pusilla]|uniref:Three-Cys-motif partner protein TcmP n=1 Tax=Nannocystis pusilla TaxID=889268 RepID=A0ABS7TQC8_9BACT|nr:three-Cys-motif partner protein TcmP [Nannocystis pusilla]MBZ5710421.1 three-Cys-motif partner protein TcmP [Nannocystis pusilla]
MSEKFFDEQREQSQVKAEIVRKYFDAWAGIISGAQRQYSGAVQKLGYVDLFAGPGRYKDGAVSTALQVLDLAVKKYADRMVTVFNDRDSENVSTLRQQIDALDGIQTLRFPPLLWNEEVGDKIAKQFAEMRTIPILAFVDPWGYKGLTLKLVDAFLKDWGCDCIFFFNYNRINAGLSNPLVRQHMQALFGEVKATELERELSGMKPHEREATIVEALTQSLKRSGHRYVLPFCFKNESGKRTTHHLILVTKHFKGYDVMKEIMAKASSLVEQGVPSFSYFPAASQRQELLFELNRPLDDLSDMLLLHFAGKSVTVEQIYNDHSVDRPYLRRNYKDVLLQLERTGRVRCEPAKRRAGTMAEHVTVSFPREAL